MEIAVFKYGEDRLTVGLAMELCRGERKGVLTVTAREKISRSRKIVEGVIAENRVVYGVTTGFGPLCTTFVSGKDASRLQHNLLRSHSVGVGDHIPGEIAKLMLILKVHALTQGYSGVSIEVIERILWHIESNVIPCVPEQGSVGASGDLAPLSHLFLPLIGLGMVEVDGKEIAANEALSAHGLPALQLKAKEGLGLINGTQFMAAYGIKIVERLQNCLDQADISAAMMLEALAGSAKPFHLGLHTIRAHQGNLYVAARMRALLEESEILNSHIDCGRVQDPYSLRCIPQVHGASRNAWLHLKETLEVELNSVTDNPILLDAEQIISGGNFHGQPIALPLDYAGLAAAELGNISDRRIYLSLDGKVEGLPKLLLKETGLNSGFMIPQYTTAALVTENKSLCFPASADSVPTSMGQEDHVSMGSISGRKSYKIIKNLEQILGIELLCAAQALDFRRPLKSSKLIEACHGVVRSKIPHRTSDELFGEEFRIVIELVREGALTKAAKGLDGQEHQVFGLY